MRQPEWAKPARLTGPGQGGMVSGIAILYLFIYFFEKKTFFTFIIPFFFKHLIL